MKRAEQAEVMIAGLRAAGSKGMTAVELFDCGVKSPYEVCELINERPGYSVMRELEDSPQGGGWKTFRFTLIVDGDPQDYLFEGEASDQLETYLERAAA